MTRSRVGIALTMLGVVGLPAALCGRWFGARLHCGGWTCYSPLPARGHPLHESGWRVLEAPVIVLVALTLALALVGLAALARDTDRRGTLAVMTTTAGVLLAAALLARLVAPPGSGLDYLRITVRWPAYLGFACALAIAAGSWTATSGGRLGTPRSRRRDAALRPIPPTS